ncbi:septum site-determining protein MinC [Desulforamulus reducens MI-1]|uniref:Probable septum site-determining protein MinC n=1 Tax=Desulforamulus reducens (strain ATCC BAA-1160 / DSM 100696 / MI-1) TaxID=349161 RepID=A4J5R8_DESRM|nr:septum site-determining protein MinC [Desulforamulus reducens]ABO50421.1 septum site-determining protein MinC [Desulforamulus reducens MI-1]
MNDAVSIKGTRHGLLILVDPNSDFEEIKQNLYKKMEAARGFFKGAKFAFSQVDNEQSRALEEICQQYGLIYQPDIKDKINNSPVNSVKTPLDKAQETDIKASDTKDTDTLLVKRSLRSGQQIHYPGHVVVLGDVHAGAEILAYGNVLVMGACRGVVHAGANGNQAARVIAHRLCPAQLRIGTSIACAPSDSQDHANYPEIAYLSKDSQIIVEYYNSRRPAGRTA